MHEFSTGIIVRSFDLFIFFALFIYLFISGNVVELVTRRVLTCASILFQYIAAGPHPYPFYPGPGPIIHAVPIADSEQTSNAASPEEPYQPYQNQPAK